MNITPDKSPLRPEEKPFSGSFYNEVYKGTPLSLIEEEAERQGPVLDRIILPWLPTERTSRIYEAACGPGMMLRWLRKRGYMNVSASDASATQIELARSAGFPVKVGDSLQELRDAAALSLDCVIAFNFYEHLTRELMLDFFSISARVLKPGGCLILLGPNGDTPVVGRALFNDITHQWALTSYSFTQVLKMAGFGSVQFKDGATASIRGGRLIKVPLILAAQTLLRILFRLATLERIEYFTSSFYICARKSSAPNE